MYLSHEECMYAKDRGLISEIICEYELNPDILLFYTTMKNRGLFLTRSLLTVLNDNFVKKL